VGGFTKARSGTEKSKNHDGAFFGEADAIGGKKKRGSFEDERKQSWVWDGDPRGGENREGTRAAFKGGPHQKAKLKAIIMGSASLGGETGGGKRPGGSVVVLA